MTNQLYTKPDIIGLIETEDMTVLNKGLSEGFYELEIYKNHPHLAYDLDAKISQSDWDTVMDNFRGHDNI